MVRDARGPRLCLGRPMDRTRTVRRLVLGLATVATLAGTSLATPAPFDRSQYRTLLPLSTWLTRDEPAETWSGRNVFLSGVVLIAEGHRRNEFYVGYCKDKDLAGSVRMRCPRVYLGKLSPDEARSLQERVGDRAVDVFFTVGSLVPRYFAPQFGVLDADHGAWIDVDGEMFRVEAEERVFGLPKDGEVAAPPVRPSTSEEARPYFTFEYRSVDDDAADEFRTLDRSSLLSGRTEFDVATSAPDWYSIERVTVVGGEDVSLDGGSLELCRSAGSSPTCTADFGPGIAGQHLVITATVRDSDGARFEQSREVTTLDTHPIRRGTATHGVVRERASVERVPYDEVVRLVRFETVSGRGEDRLTEYRTDLPAEAFRIDVAGIEGARISDVSPPPATRPHEPSSIMIPIFLSASPYLTRRGPDRSEIGWTDDYAGIVRKLSQGLERAAWNGVDARFVVVTYAASGRVFGPFRLRPGRQLGDDDKRANREALDALDAHLLEPPPEAWNEHLEWVNDLSSALHTMNDLCFRIHDGPVGALLVTNGWNDPPQRDPRFVHDLWPERLGQLDRAISPERGAEILRLLDEGRGVHDEAIDRLIVGLGPDWPLSPELLAAYVRELAPGGTSTLQPHRENRVPQMDALMVTSLISLRDRTQEAFTEMIREDFGGEIHRLYEAKKTSAEKLEEALHDPRQSSGALTFSAMIEKIHDQLRGLLAIVRLDAGYEVIPSVVAEKIKLRDESCIVSNAATQAENEDDDPYADYKVPDDLMW